MKSFRRLKILGSIFFVGIYVFTLVIFCSNPAQAVERNSGILVLSGAPQPPRDLKANLQVTIISRTIDSGDGKKITGYFPTQVVKLQWYSGLNDPENQTYVVYRSTSSLFTGVPSLAVVTSSLEYMDADLDFSNTTTYYYKVAARNDRGEGYNSEAVSITVVGFSGRGPIAGEVQGEIVKKNTLPSRLWTPVSLSSRIAFKGLPQSDQVAMAPGQVLNFDYIWTNKLDKDKIKTPNRKFLIRRRLWDSQGNKVMEKSYPYIIYPGKSKNISVHEALKSDLPKGTYTMEVEVVHYIPYKDEVDIVTDKNSFRFLVQ